MRRFSHQSRHEWTEVDCLGVAVHARVWGGDEHLAAGLPVVLVAGLGMSSSYWIPLGRRLGEWFYAVAPDMPGFGRTRRSPRTPWPGGPSAREQADQLLAWLDARGIGRAIFCGNSCGCQVIVDLAVRFPDRVEKLILTSPTFEAGFRNFRSELPRLALGGLFEKPSMALLLLAEYGKAGPARLIQQASRMMNDPIEAKALRVQAPTLIIRGQWDPLVSQRWCRLLAKKLPRAMLVEIEDVGHAVQYSAPVVTTNVIAGFIRGKLNASQPLADREVIAPRDDPRRDPLGPPQPISPWLHGWLDCLALGFSVALPRCIRCSPHARRWLAGAAAASVANNLVTHRPMRGHRRLPMLSHAVVDILCGSTLLLAAALGLREDSKRSRRIVGALGLYQIVIAALTAKPTGPARYIRPASTIALDDGKSRSLIPGRTLGSGGDGAIAGGEP